MLAAARTWFLTGDRWIPALFVLFFVGLAVVEARLIHIALSTSTGLVTDQPAAAVAGKWQLDLDVAPLAGEAVPVRVRVREVDGRSVRGADVRVVAERASRYAQIVSVALQEQDGAYVGALRLPIGGTWDISVVAERGDERATMARDIEVAAGVLP